MEIKIYVIKNKVNGKLYIGQTIQELDDRFSAHINALRKQSHNNHKLQDDFNIYGESVFEMNWVETINENDFIGDCDDILLETCGDIRESFYIEEYETIDKGYNLSSGGNLGKVQHESTREKIRQSVIGEKHPNFGKSLSEETKKKISNAKKGTVVSDRTKKLISEYQKNRERGPMSDEQKKKLSEINKGKKMSEEAKRKLSELNKKKLSEELKEQIAKCLLNGSTVKDTCLQCNCIRADVYRVKTELGLVKKKLNK